MGSGGKSQSVSTGFIYYGRMAMSLCLGPVDRLHAVYNGEDAIWTGPVDRVNDADSFGRTVLQTDLGRVDFHWGASDQTVNPVFGGLRVGDPPLPHTPFRGVCYWVGVDIRMGAQPTPPNLIFDLERIPRAIPGLSDYAIEGEALVPDVIMDLLTDPLWGMGLPLAQIDLPSFAVGADVTRGEGLTIGAVLDTADQARGLIGALLQYIGGYLFESRGKVYLALDRAADLESAPVLDSSVLAGEPGWTEEGHEETFGETRLAWRDHERDDERTTEIYTDLASMAVQSRIRRQTIDLDWIRRRDVAKRVVARIGQRAAIAARTYTLAVIPSVAVNLRPGDVAILHYPAAGLSSRPVRLLSIRRGGPGRRSVAIEAVDDLATDSSTWSLPEVDPISVPSGLTPPPLQNPLMRVGILPSELVPSGEDGFIACIQRRTQHVLGADLYFAGHDGGTWRLQRRVNRFPAAVEILWWTPVRETNWLIRIRPIGAPDRATIEALAESTGMLLVSGAHDDGAEQTMLFWGRYETDGIFEPVGSDTWDIELQGVPPYAAVQALRIGSEAEAERAPTITAFFGLLGDFGIHTNTDIAFGGSGVNGVEDQDRIRFVRTPTFDRLKDEPLDDAAEATYDQPAGEYAPTWGASAMHAVEAFDTHAGAWIDADGLPSDALLADYASIEDIDEALGAIYGETATAEQLFRFEAIDEMLGNYFSEGFYR